MIGANDTIEPTVNTTTDHYGFLRHLKKKLPLEYLDTFNTFTFSLGAFTDSLLFDSVNLRKGISDYCSAAGRIKDLDIMRVEVYNPLDIEGEKICLWDRSGRKVLKQPLTKKKYLKCYQQLLN